MSTEGTPPPIVDPVVEPTPEAPRAPTAAEIAWAQNQHAVANGASWFTWIAALGAINAFLVLANSPIGFAVGFIFTDYAVAIAKELGSPIIGIAIALVASALFYGLGILAGRGAMWAFILGIVILTLDTFLGLVDLSGNVIGIAIHLWAIWNMTGGAIAISKLKKMSRGEAV